MNDIEWNALFYQSDKGLLKARVSRIEVAMATSVKRASDLTSQLILELHCIFYQRFTHYSKLIAANKRKKERQSEGA